jgi:hypothetical protein
MKGVELGHVFLAFTVFSQTNEGPKHRLHGSKK